ncbi:threonylcarbamoyladenosine tRNA methylthiotransferase MtaB [Anaerobacterium chartisolvens]|uniref:Threonylcarbamoyladenosine tRNA methylthiotransferase MtaB n=2 Tax=Anaerobacterium chartisolvens TaxID=1297424 RepID=A0A369BAQ4_9FIRM|nr:threonylcarbamoyladenosine tRNA methylthiotransferase MtaB [Anaerobacterium chartisolvens]
MKDNNGKVDLSLDGEEFFRQYGRKKTVGMFTLGCKVNQYETEAMAGIFRQKGYEVVDFSGEADVYVINTCTVTSLSDRKSRQMIRRAKSSNKNSIVAVVGCYSQASPEEVRNIPGVNVIIGTRERSKIVDYVNEIEADAGQVCIVENIMKEKSFEALKIDAYEGRTRAFLKIQEGCSQFCAYCIIPYARGPIRSRPHDEILSEVERLSESGFKEVVLTGIHIASYGKDIKSTSLTEIIRQVHEVKGIERIRLGSLEPMAITDEFIGMAKELTRLCPHYHLSLQSGCNATLNRMNRKYSVAEYKEVVERLRQAVPDVAITTDIMVGFPGETDSEFRETYRFIEEISFAQMHIFKYSRRKGTPAADFEDQISSELKEERAKTLTELARLKTLEFNSRFIGRIMPVLFEQHYAGVKGMIEGLTPNYIKVISRAPVKLKGQVARVEIESAEQDYAAGKIVE